MNTSYIDFKFPLNMSFPLLPESEDTTFSNSSQNTSSILCFRFSEVLDSIYAYTVKFFAVALERFFVFPILYLPFASNLSTSNCPK